MEHVWYFCPVQLLLWNSNVKSDCDCRIWSKVFLTGFVWSCVLSLNGGYYKQATSHRDKAFPKKQISGQQCQSENDTTTLCLYCRHWVSLWGVHRYWYTWSLYASFTHLLLTKWVHGNYLITNWNQRVWLLQWPIVRTIQSNILALKIEICQSYLYVRNTLSLPLNWPIFTYLYFKNAFVYIYWIL